MNKRNMIYIWPNYFDLNKTRKNGRRVPKSLAVSSPKLLDVKEALAKLNLKPDLFLEVSYPKTAYIKSGLITLKKDGKKNLLLKEIAKALKKN